MNAVFCHVCVAGSKNCAEFCDEMTPTENKREKMMKNTKSGNRKRRRPTPKKIFFPFFILFSLLPLINVILLF